MNYVVLGAGFGDEGKGKVVDYLSSFIDNSIVIRFSGGQQAGHTVFNKNNSHVFSCFGSGAFHNKPTYWSKYCTVDPIAVLKELSKLKELNLNPILYIDMACPVTTPYDKLHNIQDMENVLHGTCGAGVGKTYKREEDFYSFKIHDLMYPQFLNVKLDAISSYYKFKIADELRIEFIESCKELFNNNNIFPTYKENVLPSFENKIFEGSQGLLLDQHFGFFPNVTRSNIGTKNVIEFLEGENIDKIYLVSRAYQTRHGNGFMTNDKLCIEIKDNPYETNKTNEYQGKFRKSIFDFELIRYGIEKDEFLRKNRKLITFCLTCIDLFEDGNIPYTKRNKDGFIEIYNSSLNEFVKNIREELYILDVQLSNRPVYYE